MKGTLPSGTSYVKQKNLLTQQSRKRRLSVHKLEADMTDKSFKDTFKEVGAGWPTKKGTGTNIKFKEPIPAGVYVLMFNNRNRKSNSHPSVNAYVKYEDLGQVPESDPGSDPGGFPGGDDFPGGNGNERIPPF
jgi:hypothetical protein